MPDLTYRSPKTEVRESPIHGRGLFATQAIATGEIVAVKGGHILTKEAWTALERELGAADIQIAEGLFIAPGRQDQRHGGMLYTNHSCDPNDVPETARRAAFYVDRILKGAHPRDLPVEEPTRFELAANLGTAKTLGLTIPSSLLLQAQHVVRP